MAIWTHVTGICMGDFDSEELTKLLGKEVPKCSDYIDFYNYKSLRYKKAEKCFDELCEQSKMPAGSEGPLYYRLVKGKHHERSNCSSWHSDELYIFGNLRNFSSYDFEELQNLCIKIVSNFSFRNFVMQAYCEDGTTYIWSSVWGDELNKIVIDDSDPNNIKTTGTTVWKKENK